MADLSDFKRGQIVGALSDFKRGQIVGARVASASVIKSA